MSMRRFTSVVCLCLALAGCGGSPGADPTTSPPPSATAAAQPADELEGTWRTPEKTKTDLVAAARGAGCSEEYIDSFFATTLAGYMATTFVSTLRFEGGSFGEFQSYDGGPEEHGSDGTYRLDDGQLILMTPGYAPLTFDYELEGDQLTLRLQKYDCGIDLWPAIIFEGAPFTREATG